jgi:CheY-like chemotaxis protein
MKLMHILLIEDDTLDQVDVMRTLRKRNILHRLTIAKNGEEAFALMNAGKDDSSLIPDIILLDLNMPLMSGIELLRLIKTSETWSDAKVFVLTTSNHPDDRRMVNELGVSGFIVKPLKLDTPGSMDAFNLMMDLMNG